MFSFGSSRLLSRALSLSALVLACSLGAAHADIAYRRGARSHKPAPVRVVSAPARSGEGNEISEVERFEAQVVELTNRERARFGLPPLKRQQNLMDSARWMAKDMAEQGYFDHTDSRKREMPDRVASFQYGNYHEIAENIAMGWLSPAEVVDGWMHSPGHRENMLSPEYCEIGVGYCPPSASSPSGFWVQDFGARFDIYPMVINNDEDQTRKSQVKLTLYGKEWANEIRLSNDGVTWTDWESFKPHRDWTLDEGSGKRTLYAELRHGRTVQRVQASIQILPEPASTKIASARMR